MNGSPQTRVDEEELQQLIIRYQAADLAAADELIRRLSPLLFRFLYSPLKTRSWTEDVLQDCWLQIHQARHSFRPGSPVLPWIFAIARNTRRDWYRRQCRRDFREVPLMQSHVLQDSFPEPISVQKEGLRPLLAVLPPSQREVLVMLKLSEMSLEEVAQATSSTVGSVKQKAHRAYRKLKKIFGDAPRG